MLNQAHHVYIVQHLSSKKIFIKKELRVYNSDVYRSIMEKPLPYLPRIYEMYEEDGMLTIIEEYISGNTLEEYLDTRKNVSIEEALDCFTKICKVVSSLHHCNPPIIHRDIKPSNIILTESREVYLIDINAAKYVSGQKAEDTTLLGTHGYAAPEQYGFGSSDQHTDIYALGILLKQLLKACTHKEDQTFHLYEAVIKKCTQMEASRRYDSIERLLEDIDGIQEHHSLKTYRSYLPPGFRSGNIKHMLVAIFSYPLLAYMCFGTELKDVPANHLVLEQSILFVAFLIIIAFFWNYCDIQKRLLIKMPQNKVLHLLVLGCAAFLILLMAGILMAMLD